MSSSSTDTGEKIQIVIADDHPIVREGLAAILGLQERFPDCCPGGRWRGSLPGFASQLSSLDILILDLRMPRKDGLEVVTELMSKRSHPRIIVLTNSTKAEDLRRALKAGAKGYLLKGAEPQQVWTTIREVFAGKSSLPRDVALEIGGIHGSTRTFSARTPGSAANGHWQKQQGDRAGSLHQREHREASLEDHFQKAERDRPNGGHRDRVGTRTGSHRRITPGTERGPTFFAR